jgi:isopenicillin N synthase-like dioxygenase
MGIDARLPESLPVLRWQDIEDTSSRRLLDCCTRQGAFYIVDDGRLSARAPAVFREAQAFFSQPAARKMRFAARPDNQFLGYRGIGSEASMLENQTEFCEQFKVGYLRRDARETEDTADRMLGENVFAAGATRAYWQAVQAFADDLMASIGEVLDLGRDYFAAQSRQPLHQLGLNHYPPGCEGEISMSGHIDLSLITLVGQQVPGLHIQSAAGNYQLAEPRPGAVLCMLGEYLRRWSGGSFQAPMHRVSASEGSARFSIIYKHRPSYDAVIRVPLFCAETGGLVDQQYATGPAYEQKIFSIMGHAAPQQSAVDAATMDA